MFTAAFTDPQGVKHSAAVFQVLRADFSSNTNESFVFNVSDGTTSSPSDNSSFSLNYQVAYWPTEAAKNKGVAPYVLIDPSTYSADFSDYSLDPAVYSGLSAEQAAEEHCKREIIKAVV